MTTTKIAVIIRNSRGKRVVLPPAKVVMTSVNTNGNHPWMDKRLDIPSPKEGDWYDVLDVPYDDKKGYPQWRIGDDGIPDTDVSIRRWRYSGELGQFICDFCTPPIDVSAWAAETLFAK